MLEKSSNGITVCLKKHAPLYFFETPTHSMDAHTFRARVLAIQSMPQALLQYLAVLGETLKPDVRREMVEDLEWGDKNAVNIVQGAVEEIAELQPQSGPLPDQSV